MTIKQSVILYLITLAVFFLIDMVWLGAVARGFYSRHLGTLMRPKVVWPAAVASWKTSTIFANGECRHS